MTRKGGDGTEHEKYTVCGVCPHACRLKEGDTGFCRARVCRGGRIVPENYGRITSLALDPIEKKPLAGFYPGSLILSAGSYGCNFRCPFCQNHSISDIGGEQAGYTVISPSELVRTAEELVPRGNIGIAFTYNEPVISWEYVLDTEKLAKEKGLRTVLVTNGCAGEKVWDTLIQHTDALNIDLKAFTGRFYSMIKGDLETVKRNIAAAHEKCHVELTTLIIPGENDTREEIAAIAQWISKTDPDIILHISRFFPRHRMTDRKATDVSLIYSLADEARRYLRNVYTGNC